MRTKLLVGTLVCAAVASGTYMFTGCVPGIDISNVFAAALDADGVVRIGSAKTDIVDALAKDYGESDGDKLSDLSEADLAKILVDAKMVVADLSELTVAQLEASPLFKAALANGIPVLLDNVADSEKMAKIAGIGLPAIPKDTKTQLSALGVPEEDHDFTVLLEPLKGTQELLVSVFGPPHRFESSLATSDSMTDEEIPMEETVEDDELAQHELAEFPAEEVEVAQLVTAGYTHNASRLQQIEKRLAHVNEFPAHLKDVIRGQQNNTGLDDLGTAQMTWWVRFPDVNWTPGDGQQGFTDVDYRVDLFASKVPFNRFLRVTAVGTGTAPGSLKFNDHRNLGWFQDQVILEFGPAPAGANNSCATDSSAHFGHFPLEILQHSPANANNTTDVTSSTGFSVGLSGDSGGTVGGNYTYSENQSITTQLKDFKTTNQTDPLRGRWDYRLENVAGSTYNFDHPEKTLPHRSACHVEMHGLPTLATNTFQPNAQVVWRADGDYAGLVNMHFYVKHRATKVKVTSEHCKFIHTVSWHATSWWQTHCQQMDLAVDFGAVSTGK